MVNLYLDIDEKVLSFKMAYDIDMAIFSIVTNLRNITLPVSYNANGFSEFYYKLLDLEKFSTGKNKMTYMMIPANHPIYPFPYNLEDRADYIENKLKVLTNNLADITVKKEEEHIYKIYIKNDKNKIVIIFKERC